MNKFKIYDQVIITDRWAQYTTPREKDTIALTHFKRERSPTVIQWEATWKNYRIKWEIVKIIPEDDKYWVRLPDHGKHIVIGEYWLALDDQNSITNTTDLHGSDPDQYSYEGTYARVSCEEDYNTTVKFYEKKWIKGIDNERQDRIRYIRTDHLWKRLYTWSERLLKKNCSDLRDITQEVFEQIHNELFATTKPNSYLNTFINIRNNLQRQQAIDFYKDKWYDNKFSHKYDSTITYIRLNDKGTINVWGKSVQDEYTEWYRDITKEVLPIHISSAEAIPAIQNFMMEQTLLNSNFTPMTNTLEQLKFDKYVKANQSKIVDLSDEIDNKLKLIANIVDVCSELRIDAATANQGMSKAFENCDRSALDSKFTKLKNYEKLFNSWTFDLFIKAFKDFDIAIDKIINA